MALKFPTEIMSPERGAYYRACACYRRCAAALRVAANGPDYAARNAAQEAVWDAEDDVEGAWAGVHRSEPNTGLPLSPGFRTGY
jgi:hypothetical protein